MKKENMRAYLISGPGFFQRCSAWAFCRRRPRRCPCCSRCSCQRSGRAATGQSPGSSGRKADTLKDVRSDPPRPRPRSSLGLPCSALRMCPAKRRPRMRPQPPAAVTAARCRGLHSRTPPPASTIVRRPPALPAGTATIV